MTAPTPEPSPAGARPSPRWRPAEDDRPPPAWTRLQYSLATELNAQLGLRGETIELADVPEIAYALVAPLSHEFHIEHLPEPEPESPDEGPDSACFHASTLPAGRYPVFDHD